MGLAPADPGVALAGGYKLLAPHCPEQELDQVP